MFTTWQQVEEWIRDNQFDHWLFSRQRDGKDKLVDSDYYAGDFEDKLAMTRKYLEMNGGVAYGTAFKKPNIVNGGAVCEVRLDSAYAQNMQPMPMSGNSTQDIGALRETIRAEIEAKFERENLKREKEEFEKEKKKYEEDRNGVLGAIVGYLAPYLPVINSAKESLRQVAGGLDAPGDVRARRIIADDGTPLREEVIEQTQESTQRPFTDEEEEKLYDLLARFKAVEPQYMELIEAVVKMAEEGNTMYGVAKNALLKG